MKTFKELYKKGNQYKCTSHDVNCEIVDIRYSKTGRISAKVKNEEWGEFWTSSVSPDKTIDFLNVNRSCVTEDFKI